MCAYTTNALPSSRCAIYFVGRKFAAPQRLAAFGLAGLWRFHGEGNCYKDNHMTKALTKTAGQKAGIKALENEVTA